MGTELKSGESEETRAVCPAPSRLLILTLRASGEGEESECGSTGWERGSCPARASHAGTGVAALQPQMVRPAACGVRPPSVRASLERAFLLGGLPAPENRGSVRILSQCLMCLNSFTSYYLV